jgi:2-oxo-4-hydroxy-4-carboxy-5-ureidoimidazoline decarboxylase
VLEIPEAQLRERLAAALSIPRWVDEVAANAPFRNVDDLVRAGRSAATALTDSELDDALVPHPPLAGETEGATGGSSSLGRETGLAAADEGLDAALARGNRVYEERFGRPFLIRATGRSREEVADELQRRLTNSPDEEAEEAKEQLRQILEVRLRALFPEET